MRNILISIIRHGQTDCNLRGVLQGQMETSLNSTGRAEADQLGVRLRNENYTHVYSSNMERAADTARIVLRNNTVSKDEVKDDIRFDARLRERSFGIFEGKPKEELGEFHEKASKEKDYLGRRHFTPPNGESIATVYLRARECLMEIVWNVVSTMTTTTTTGNPRTTNSSTGSDDASVLISTHGGVAIEMFTFLVKELNCPPPPGKDASQMIAIPGNTALSTFRLTIDDAIAGKELSHISARPKELVTGCVCLNIHDRAHCADGSTNGGAVRPVH